MKRYRWMMGIFIVFVLLAGSGFAKSAQVMTGSAVKETEEENQEDTPTREIIGAVPLEGVLDEEIAKQYSAERVLELTNGITLDPVKRFLRASGYYLSCGGVIHYPQEMAQGNVGTVHRTVYDPIRKVDQSAFCLESWKDGPPSGYYEVTGIDSKNLLKILYYGYGGPADISPVFDPTGNGTRWDNWHNRYLFTHVAASYEYCKITGHNIYDAFAGTTYELAVKSGVLRWYDKLISMPDPPVLVSLQFRTKNSRSDAQEVTYSTKSDQTLLASAYPSEGIQKTMMVMVHGDSRDSFTMKLGADITIEYWKNTEQWQENPDTPFRQTGGQIVLKPGYRFRFTAPLSKRGVWDTGIMTGSLYPVKAVKMAGAGDYQFIGTCMASEEPARCRIRIQWAGTGKVELEKTDAENGQKLKGAVFGIYAKDRIYSGLNLKYEKNQKVMELTTDDKGKAVCDGLYAGSYMIKEEKAPKGYVQKLWTKEVGITSENNSILCKCENERQKGKIYLEKKNLETQDTQVAGDASLEGAVYGVYHESGSLAEKIVTDKDGKAQSGLLELGNYVVREISPSSGFQLDPKEYKVNLQAENQKESVWTQTVVSLEPPAYVNVILTKKIKAQDINWYNGNPVFFFELEQMENEKNCYRRYVEFEEAYVRENTDEEGYTQLSVEFRLLPTGTYLARELPVARYRLESIDQVEKGEIQGEEICFILKAGETGRGTFENEKYEWQDYSHNSLVENSFHCRVDKSDLH